MNSNKSANALFHFTGNFENLKSIIKNKLYPKYCLEDFSLALQSDDSELLGIPMVSFCDIPLSQIYNHVNFYGSYAIGLKKEWGIKNNVVPVIYTYKDSLISKCFGEFSFKSGHLNDSFSKFVKDDDEQKNEKLKFFSDFYDSAMRVLYYLKPYEGKVCKNGELTNKDKRFYDEREWRYVPLIKPNTKNDTSEPYPIMSKSFFEYLHGELEKANDSLIPYKLIFEPNDIKYLILKNENEIPEIIKFIHDSFDSVYTYNDIQILTSKIISIEQILDDF